MSAPTLILETPYVKLVFHQADRIVHHELLQRSGGEELQRALITGLSVLQKFKAERWLSDDRQNPVLAEADEQWLQEVWFPAAERSGCRSCAIVSLHKEQKRPPVQGRMTVATFTDPVLAFRWLAPPTQFARAS
jgi:hypothetical protein